MKIAVLGSRGFVGSSLTKYLSENNEVISVNRDTLDFLDSTAVREFLTYHKFDVIVNAAASMTDNALLDDTRNNLGIFMNFYNERSQYGKFINLASGAEFDRSRNIENALEEDIFDVFPKDSYGFGQNMKSRITYETPEFYNIRIFNCFGYDEPATRIFARYLKNSEDPLVITNDRYFDYFSIQDLCLLVDHCISNNWTVKDVNAVYLNKIKISQALDLFCSINGLKPNFTVASYSNDNYTGSGKKLESLGVALQGLDSGFKKYYIRSKNDRL